MKSRGIIEIGHTVHMCQLLQEFIQKDIIRQNMRESYIIQSVASIYKATFEEQLIIVIKHILTPASKFITVNTMLYTVYL